MRVSIIKSSRINNIILPSKIEGNYWISGIDENGIRRNLMSTESENGKWKLISNNDVYCVSNNRRIPFVYLEVGNYYLVYNDIEKSYFVLYCSNIDIKYQAYQIQNRISEGITIGSNPNNLVVYSSIDDYACFIKLVNGKVYIVDNNSKNGIYVNDIRIRKEVELKIGDIIFISGLKIILSILNNSYCLYINTNDVKNLKVNLEQTNKITPLNTPFTESTEEVEFKMYNENEYFHKVPRFFRKNDALELTVDPPPTKVDEKDQPIILTIGPMLTMSMTSLVMGYASLSSVFNGSSTWGNVIPSLIICGAMIATVFIWPVFTKWYNKKTRIKQEKERQKKYSKYIESKRQIIKQEKINQESLLKNNYMTSIEASNVILKRFTNLWQRRIDDDDYLEVNLGEGSIPMEIKIKYPEDHFTMAEDNLVEIASTLSKEPKMLNGVPIVLSLTKNYISGFIGGDALTDYVKRLLVQILAQHSYDDLKIVVLTDEEKAHQWNFLKNIPHVFSDDKSIRFFATNSDEYKSVCYYLDNQINAVKEKNANYSESKESFNKIYLIITDSFKKVREFDVFNNILNSKTYLGFSLMILDTKITNLPDQCGTFINLNDSSGELRSSENINKSIGFKADLISPINYDALAKVLCNIPIEQNENDDSKLVDRVGFLEMYDVGKVEQLNSSVRWATNNPILSLQAPVGIGKTGEIISLDLHEKFHGPHGLIAGMTGSGKSEFIITYILSMAINYHPYEVQFILIDYKGGGLAGAFENKITGLKLPHLVGTITNLDTNEIMRSLVSIESELKRRQALFNKAREISGESTIDIYKYQRMYREKIVSEPISHLFIICDEFAELKHQQPDFMDKLISVSRIGRSLGVHLILSTQRPSGVVDPQIWSNTRFRICLRVQDKSDSNDIIKSPDAAYLKQTGRFYFQVGYNEIFSLGQSAYAGGKYIPTEKVVKVLDTSIDFIDNVGYVYKKTDTKVKNLEQKPINLGEELINIVKYLSDIAKDQNIKCQPLWLEKMSSDIRVEDLAYKYNYKKENYIINPIIGEYDIPSRQEQRLLTLPLTNEGNALIYGASGSGKENLITTLIYSSELYYSPEELNYYVMDFGSESLKMFNDYPIVGDVLTSSDDEKIRNLYKMLNDIVEERKVLFAEYNGDYYTYCKNSGDKVPAIVVVINSYESYQEMYDDLSDELIMLTRDCNKYGIYFVITVNTPNGVRFKLKQNFAIFYSLQQNNDDDYTSILGNVHKNYPDKIFGRGIFRLDDVYEFQTALVAERDNIIRYIKDKKNEFLANSNIKAKSIPVLPVTVSYKDIYSEFGKSDEMIIGIDKNTLELAKFNFIKNYVTIITSFDLNITESFINPLINQMIATNKSTLIVINAEDYTIDNTYKSYYNYYSDNFDKVFENLCSYIKSKKEQYIKNNYSRKIFENDRKITCMIIGIESFKNRLDESIKDQFGELFVSGKDLGIINFIIVDSISKIKKFEIDSWYKTCVNSSYGIWFGNGINEQFTIRIAQKINEMRQDIPNNFCFVIKRGKVQYVKYVENLKLK